MWIGIPRGNDTSRPRPAIVWIAIAVLIGAYAGWLTVQYDRQRAHLEAAHAREQAMVQQFHSLVALGRSDTVGAAAPEALTVALLERPDLIPFEPVLGGTFYYREDTVRALSDRWLYVAVEDGHIAGHMLLEYRRGEGGATEFRVVDAYQD